MLLYLIELLKKASFDRILFSKELDKSRRWLTKDEMASLLKWVRENYPVMMEQMEKQKDSKYPARINQSNGFE